MSLKLVNGETDRMGLHSIQYLCLIWRARVPTPTFFADLTHKPLKYRV